MISMNPVRYVTIFKQELKKISPLPTNKPETFTSRKNINSNLEVYGYKVQRTLFKHHSEVALKT